MHKQPSNWVSELVAGASEASFAIDTKRCVIAWNQSAERLLGRAAAETIGCNCGRVLRATLPDGSGICGARCDGFACFLVGDPWSETACELRHAEGHPVRVGLSSMVVPVARRQDAGEAVAIVFMHDREARFRPAPGEPALRFHTLGSFGAQVGEETLDTARWRRQQALIVLKCLISSRGRPLHRERLIEWLWPEDDPARAWPRLKVAVSFLRARLRAAVGPVDIIETVGDCYRLRQQAVWTDAHVFEMRAAEGRQRMKAGDKEGATALLKEAEALYRGDFLEDDLYADWCAAERERMREVRLDLLADLVQCNIAAGDGVEAVRLCHRAIAVDLSRETFVRSLMEALVGLGQIEAARAQFLSWQRSLAEEFDLSPMPETLDQFRALDRPRRRRP